MTKRRNQRKLARFLFGIAGIFFAVCAYQWIQDGFFSSRFGGLVKREEDPFRFWTVWSAAAIGSTLLIWTCCTWKSRAISKQFSDEETGA